MSPWTALEYCVDPLGINNTWVCHAPESCGCKWDSTTEMLILQQRGCQDMGSDARVALHAPSVLAPYVSLPRTIGASTGYFSATKVNGTSTWITTAIDGCTWLDLEIPCLYGGRPLTDRFRYAIQDHTAYRLRHSAYESRVHQLNSKTFTIYLQCTAFCQSKSDREYSIFRHQCQQPDSRHRSRNRSFRRRKSRHRRRSRRRRFDHRPPRANRPPLP